MFANNGFYIHETQKLKQMTSVFHFTLSIILPIKYETRKYLPQKIPDYFYISFISMLSISINLCTR